ncbi:uncharacterized oxidoreductase MexAM1_META1p0182-like [Choristoneura fumiferana]|uniref:uncharacterized oxidoreductase MexAM1_META1p0182-like n=1 Tax=Choristoneura fumiferana TaxID=7141 RepID=UPI003D15EB70
MSFSSKVVIVTGASSGIGAATAILFAKEGARVALVGRNEAKLGKVARQCAVYAAPLVIRADIADELQAATIVQKTIDHLGQLDVLVNNAATNKLASTDDPNILKCFDLVLNTNLRSVVQLSNLAAPHLKATKGNIINVSSIASTAIPFHSILFYCVSTAGLDHYTRCNALDLAPFGVRVNSVNPGPVVTESLENTGRAKPGAGAQAWDSYKYMTALNKISQPEEIADLIAFIASDKAKSITGSNIVTDNGFLLKSNWNSVKWNY